MEHRMRRFAQGLVAAAAVALSGCFVSDEPLITPANADYPFGQTTHLAKVIRPGESSEESDLLLKDGYYVDSRDGPPFLFKAIGANFYIVGYSLNKSMAYELDRIDGKHLYRYFSDCEDPEAEMFSATGSIQRIEPGGGPPKQYCYVKDLEALIVIFNSLAQGVAARNVECAEMRIGGACYQID